MARSLSDIYNLMQSKRDGVVELSSVHNDSKMSIIDAIMYVVSSSIWTFETVMDIFAVDTAKEINKHITGSKQYYINMLLKYQSGDTLSVDDEGTKFWYANEDVSKRIISIASVSEQEVDGYFDKHLIFKVAKGSAGNYSQIDADEIVKINEYMSQIAFAGTNFDVVSYGGDILIPKIVVVYSPSRSQDDIKKDVQSAIDGYIKSLSFSSKCYPNRIIESILKVDGVVDVVNDDADHTLGIFSVSPNKYGTLDLPVRRVSGFETISGYLRQSNKTGDEASIENWDEAITYKVEAQ